MVAWAADGDITGYNPTTKTLTTGIYKFASPGTVDVQAITRLRWAFDSPPFNQPNRLEASARMTFTAADAAANSGKKLSMVMVVASADWFPEGKIPTPAEIIALGDSKVGVYLSDWYWNTIPVSETRTFFFTGNRCPGPGALSANTKYWVLMYPTAAANMSAPWRLTNYKPMTGASINTIGRAISVWANRTPTAPVITSPPSGAIVQPGATFNLAYAPGDPDATVPADEDRYNADLAGVQIEYAPLPTQEAPNPQWRPLPYVVPGTLNIVDAAHVRGKGGGYLHNVATLPILKNLTIPILCGSDERKAGHSMLGGGDWQIRVRTFDFGHPYPKDVNPLGVVLTPTTQIDIDKYPISDVSPWSVPVRVSIPSQVPPPVLLSPKDSRAVLEGKDVRLSWLYRNTHMPPFAQQSRTVQIRKVGDPDWSTVFGGSGSQPFVDLPPTIDNPTPPAPVEVLTDGGFEGGGLDGWGPAPPGLAVGGETTINKTGPFPESHSGTHYLELGNPTSTYGQWAHPVALPEGHDAVVVKGWLSPKGTVQAYVVQCVWVDIDGNIIEGESLTPEESAAIIEIEPDEGWPSEWLPLDVTIIRPAAAASAFVMMGIVDTVTPMSVAHIDDMSIITKARYSLDDFTMEATTEYEWRVQVGDSDPDGSVQSNYSQSARFWVVPTGTDGPERPVPSETIDGATLGCGTHRAFIYRRGGKERVGELKGITHVDWNRLRDDVSTAKVVVEDWDVDCGALLKNLQTWAYELVLIRDNGFSKERVWEGPITLLTYEEDKIAVHAKDVMAFAYRRIMRQAMNDSGKGNGTTVVDRAARVLRNAFAPDDPNVLAYLTTLTRDDDAMQYRSTPAYARTAFEEVDDMAANSGLDYTAVGRSIILWGTKHRIGTLPEFNDKALGASPIVSEYGMSAANVYAVSDGNGVYGVATRGGITKNADGTVSGNDPIYGRIEMLSSTWASDTPEDTGTYTQEGLETVRKSFEEYAERSIADRYTPPVVVRIPDNTTLNPSAPISIQQLVPGVVVPLRSTGTLRQVVASQKLDAVNVVEANGNETISITLSPFNRDDADLGGGEVEA